MTLHSPPNTQLRIDEVYMFISIDETGEGVCGAQITPQLVMPLIAADKTRLDAMMTYAQHIASSTGKTIKLLKFTARHEVMDIAPDGGGLQ
ncbi:hypothetical protein [Bradyrhizobium sp. 150]|uniref:hypothetical protein n=1 Tax=Bradyrhizobium sp. 150 TaxID=2782625 RepID=UPI001FF8C7CE|nr:hypothetical protein [Bradyrhizobium sp. 150]MCK1670368.1 hypothetical protein [Bradyrhizobium sp. 150]